MVEIIKRLSELSENDGMTLKNFKLIQYKTGWQVATSGIEAMNIQDAAAAIVSFNGNCGVWLSNGIYYIDKCHRVATKKEALSVGRLHNQISIFGWKTGKLAYCQANFLQTYYV